MWSIGGVSMMSTIVSALVEKNPELPLPPQLRALNNELEELIVLLG